MRCHRLGRSEVLIFCWMSDFLQVLLMIIENLLRLVEPDDRLTDASALWSPCISFFNIQVGEIVWPHPIWHAYCIPVCKASRELFLIYLFFLLFTESYDLATFVDNLTQLPASLPLHVTLSLPEIPPNILSLSLPVRNFCLARHIRMSQPFL